MQRETLIQIGMERATNEPTAIKIYDLAWDAGSDDDKTLLETVCCIYQGVDWGFSVSGIEMSFFPQRLLNKRCGVKLINGLSQENSDSRPQKRKGVGALLFFFVRFTNLYHLSVI